MYLTWLFSVAMLAVNADKEENGLLIPKNPESAYVSTVIYYSPSEIKKAEFIIPNNVKNPVLNTIIKK